MYQYLVITNTNEVPVECAGIASNYNDLLAEYNLWINSDPSNCRQSNDAIYFDIVRNQYRIPYTLPSVDAWSVAPMIGYSTRGMIAGAQFDWRGMGGVIIAGTNFLGGAVSYRFTLP
jgi:hypothetical protein